MAVNLLGHVYGKRAGYNGDSVNMTKYQIISCFSFFIGRDVKDMNVIEQLSADTVKVNIMDQVYDLVFDGRDGDSVFRFKGPKDDSQNVLAKLRLEDNTLTVLTVAHIIDTRPN